MEVHHTAVVFGRLAADKLRRFHPIDKSRDRGFIDPKCLAYFLGQSAWPALKNEQYPELCCADSKRLAENCVGCLEQAMLRERHQVKEARTPWRHA
jgi:hypothetical protein